MTFKRLAAYLIPSHYYTLLYYKTLSKPMKEKKRFFL